MKTTALSLSLAAILSGGCAITSDAAHSTENLAGPSAIVTQELATQDPAD